MISFTIPGRPQPTARARVLKSGGAFTPTSTKRAQRNVAETALRAKLPLIGIPYKTEALSVAIEVCFAYPKSMTKKRIMPGWTPMTTKPDIDNLAKTILDGCNGVLWTDDNQIASLSVRKWRVENPEDEGFHCEVYPL